MDPIIEALRAAGEPTRLRILALLGHGEMAAGELSTVLNQSQPRVSRHLKLLVEAGLLERRPEGAWVFFRLASTGLVARITQAILNEVERTDFVVGRDLERLAQVRAKRDEEAQAYFEVAALEWEALRKLHQPDQAVEEALLKAVEGDRFDLHIDLGSGTGRILEVLSPLVRRSEGVDSNRRMLALARARLDETTDGQTFVRQGDILNLPYDDQVADLVTIHQVLHFLPRAQDAVIEAARILKHGGILLIADFAPHSFEELREKHAHHRLGFSEGDVAGFCEAAGLAMRSIEKIDPEMPGQGLSVYIWCAAKPPLESSQRSAA